MTKPRIGITGSYKAVDDGFQLYLWADYFDAIERAGGIPVVFPPTQADDVTRALLENVSGLLLTGGPDVPPARYGRESHPQTQPVLPRRAEFDFRCLELAIELKMPILAICYGEQALNVHFGGTLVQDVPTESSVREEHRKKGGFHRVRIEPGTKLAQIIGADEIETNTSHHQSVDRLGKGLRITARSPEGIIEAIETADDRFILGVQWHPEELTDRAQHLSLFQAFVAAAGNNASR